MSLTAKLDGHYKKRVEVNGESKVLTIFRYHVSGSEKELEQLEQAQGDNYRLDDTTGKPMYFTTNYVSDNIELNITTNGNVVVDDIELSKLQSMVNNYGEGVTRLMLMKQQAQG